LFETASCQVEQRRGLVLRPLTPAPGIFFLKVSLCRLAEDASFIMTSNDPAGFNIIDVLAYGALGHALGFFLLAASSVNSAGYNPVPF
jgi:photosystem I reaction center subunit V